MARTETKIALTERGKASARVSKTLRERNIDENGVNITVPWYAMYMDSYYEEVCETARELREVQEA